jgi:hypothetical protein
VNSDFFSCDLQRSQGDPASYLSQYLLLALPCRLNLSSVRRVIHSWPQDIIGVLDKSEETRTYTHYYRLESINSKPNVVKFETRSFGERLRPCVGDDQFWLSRHQLHTTTLGVLRQSRATQHAHIPDSSHRDRAVAASLQLLIPYLSMQHISSIRNHA